MDRVSVIAKESDRKNAQEQANMNQRQLAFELKEQMSTAVGRKFAWRVLKKLLYNESIQNFSASVYGAVAKQEVAREIARELKAADRDGFYLMEVENEK